MAGWGDPATAAMLTIDRVCIHFSAFWPGKLRRRVCHAQPGAQMRSRLELRSVLRAVTPERRICSARDAAHAQPQ